MISNKFNIRPCFPYTYGDLVENDDTRFSHQVVNLIGSEEFQKRFFVIVSIAVMLGSSDTVVNAMPPEAGAPIAELAEKGACKMPNGVNANIEGVVGNGIPNADIPVMAAKQAVNNPINPTGTGTGPNIPQNGPNLNLGQPNQPNRFMFEGSQYNYEKNHGSKSHFCIPGPPETTLGKTVNAFGVAVGVTFICLNGYWGNPMFAALCAGIVFDLTKSLMMKTVLKQ